MALSHIEKKDSSLHHDIMFMNYVDETLEAPREVFPQIHVCQLALLLDGDSVINFLK